MPYLHFYSLFSWNFFRILTMGCLWVGILFPRMEGFSSIQQIKLSNFNWLTIVIGLIWWASSEESVDFLRRRSLRKIKREDETIWDTLAVADSGQGPPPLCLDQTEARRAERNFFWDRLPPLISGTGWPPPPPPYLKVWIGQCTSHKHSAIHVLLMPR